MRRRGGPRARTPPPTARFARKNLDDSFVVSLPVLFWHCCRTAVSQYRLLTRAAPIRAATVSAVTAEYQTVSMKRCTKPGSVERWKEGRWLGRRDSNPDTQLQRLQSYR